MPRTYVKINKAYNDRTVEAAMHDIEDGSLSIRKAGNQDRETNIYRDPKPSTSSEKSDGKNPACTTETNNTDPKSVKSQTIQTSSIETISELSIDDDDVGKYYAVLYTHPWAYYWGKLTKLFADDVDSPYSSAEIDFLKKAFISSNIDLQTWKENTAIKDIGIVAITTLFYGPVVPNYEKGVYHFPDKKVKAIFDELME